MTDARRSKDKPERALGWCFLILAIWSYDFMVIPLFKLQTNTVPHETGAKCFLCPWKTNWPLYITSDCLTCSIQTPQNPERTCSPCTWEPPFPKHGCTQTPHFSYTCSVRNSPGCSNSPASQSAAETPCSNTHHKRKRQIAEGHLQSWEELCCPQLGGSNWG